MVLSGTGKDGTEFLLIFDDGHFSEDSTFLLTEYFALTDKNVLAKNFQVSPEVFDSLSPKGKFVDHLHILTSSDLIACRKVHLSWNGSTRSGREQAPCPTLEACLQSSAVAARASPVPWW